MKAWSRTEEQEKTNSGAHTDKNKKPTKKGDLEWLRVIIFKENQWLPATTRAHIIYIQNDMGFTWSDNIQELVSITQTTILDTNIKFHISVYNLHSTSRRDDDDVLLLMIIMFYSPYVWRMK
jgi:hypothetical protein